MRTTIIAEAGVNHNGDLALAKRLVAAAADAGADLVKFQTFSADRIISPSAPKALYQLETTGAAESQHEMVRKLELDRNAHILLMEECRTVGIGFLSTAFDVDSFDLLVELGLKRVKIPSGEITNLPYLRHVSRLGYPLLLSTGMSNLGEIEAALAAIEDAGTPRSRITVLHCTTEYPAPLDEVNLQAMVSLRHAFKVDVGYSDHTVGIHVPIAAVALGATVIEKHLTLDRTLPGPDHMASLEPDEFKAMVTAIRNVECAMGDGVKRPTASELKNRSVARKSLVASQPIAKGQVFGAANMTAKRPGTGISPMRWDEVCGQVATRAFAVDEMIVL